jgi:tetratricopeptide (TPR) repeat protein
MTERMPGPERSFDVAQNTHLREFLFDIDRYADMTAKYLAHRDDLQFGYVRKERIGEVNRQGPRFLITGPRESFPQGKYTAHFQLSLVETGLLENVAIIEAVDQRGTRIFAQQAISGDDFTSAGQDEIISLTFELSEDVVDLETRLLFLNQVNVRLKRIYIQPDLSAFYYMPAMKRLWENQVDKARSILSSIVADSENVMTHYQIGLLDQQAGFWQQSQQRFQHVVERRPDLADAQYRLGLALREQGQWELAHASFLRATELLPTHLAAWQALRTAAERLHLDEQARLAEQHIATIYNPQEAYTVNLANQVAFSGYRVEQVRPGQVILHYYWEALSPMTRDYIVFVHFTNPQTKFQQDHEPHRWDSVNQESIAYPTSRWKVGELVHERFVISVPAGTFDIVLGMWDPVDTRKRLPVLTSSQLSSRRKDRIQIKNVRIE